MTASNYSLSSGTFNVTARPVTLTTNRLFDNTKNVDATNLSVTFNNLVGSETLSLSGLGSVSSENVASGQQVSYLRNIIISGQFRSSVKLFINIGYLRYKRQTYFSKWVKGI